MDATLAQYYRLPETNQLVYQNKGSAGGYLPEIRVLEHQSARSNNYSWSDNCLWN